MSATPQEIWEGLDNSLRVAMIRGPVVAYRAGDITASQLRELARLGLYSAVHPNNMTELGQAVSEHGKGVVDNRKPQGIWERMSPAHRLATLHFSGESGTITPADMAQAAELRKIGLVVGWSTLTKLGREVAEYGKKHS